jgi:sulfate transport system substrate-binding protein
LLNVSYDPTREMFAEFNAAFAAHWKSTTGSNIVIQQSHGGSGKQARAVMDGLDADVVTLALAYDLDMIAAKAKLLATNWQQRLPHNSAPYTSTIVFLVRAGNPKGIKDWDDLVKTNVAIITPNPKTSGGARWNYLAAWGWASKRNNGDESKTRDFMARLFKNVPVLDAGARGATTTFAQRGIGDVLIAWENEAQLAKRESASGGFEIVYPSASILAEPPVAVVDYNANRHGTTALATAYLNYLFTPEGQEIAAKHHFRPRDEKVFAKWSAEFPKIEMFTIDAMFGGWQNAHKQHFGEGGSYETVERAMR